MTELVPPHSLEHEMCTLGAMLLDADAVATAADMLATEDFYRTDHRQIFAAMTDLNRDKKPTDLVTIPEELRKRGQLAEVGGVAYLAELAQCVPSAANVEHYATVVRTHAVTRRVIAVAAGVVKDGYRANADTAEEFVEAAERKILAACQISGGKPADTIGAAGRRLLTNLERPPAERAHRPVMTGISGIDSLLKGHHPGEYMILAGRPGDGKSSLALQIAEHAAEHNGPVYFVSREMTAEKLAARSLCARSQVSGSDVRARSLSGFDIERLRSALPQLDRLPITIDRASSTIGELRAAVRRAHAKSPLALVVIDYAQMIGSGRNEKNRNDEVTKVSKGIMDLVAELTIPVLLLSQLSRDQEKAGREPRSSDLRDSGSLEQDAHIIMFLHAPDPKNPKLIKAIVTKNRDGATGDVLLKFDRFATRFADGGNHDFPEPPPDPKPKREPKRERHGRGDLMGF